MSVPRGRQRATAVHSMTISESSDMIDDDSATMFMPAAYSSSSADVAFAGGTETASSTAAVYHQQQSHHQPHHPRPSLATSPKADMAQRYLEEAVASLDEDEWMFARDGNVAGTLPAIVDPAISGSVITAFLVRNRSSMSNSAGSASNTASDLFPINQMHYSNL